MSTVLSADFYGNPLPAANWQEDLDREAVYFDRVYRRRFRSLSPELRGEMVQEALAQTCVILAGQYRTHGGRTEHRHNIARCVASHVKQGRSCTRPMGRNADPLDHSFRASGPKRSDNPLRALERCRAGRELSADFRLHLLDWVHSLPDRLRQYALLACAGTPDVEIRRAMGVSVGTLARCRQKLRKLWEDHEKDSGP